MLMSTLGVSGITRYVRFIMWQKLNILQNDVIKLECVVEYCNTVDSSVVVMKFIHNADVNIGSFWNNEVR